MLEKIKNFILWFKSFFHETPDGLPTKKLWNQLHKETLAVAEAMGKAELPAANTTEWSDHELKIQKVALQEKEYLTKVLEHEKEIAANKMAAFLPQILLTELRNKASFAITNFTASMQKHTLEVFLRKRECDGRKSELDYFKLKHKVKHESNKPKSVIMHFAILLVIFLIEMLSNAFFFSTATGFLEGFALAFVFSIIGISLAWVVSFFIRHSLHINILHKLFFSAAAIISFVILVALILLVAHLRDFQSENPLIAFGKIDPFYLLDRLIQDTFVFKSINSYLLTFIMLIFSIIAIVDWFLMDDWYPNYGMINAKYKESFIELEECRKLQINLLQECRDSAINANKELHRNIEMKLIQQASIISIYNLKEQQFIKSIESLKAKANALISEFRKINKSSRKTPAPNYFVSEYLNWSDLYHHEVKPALSGEALHILQQEFAKTIEESNRQIESIFLEYHNQLIDGTAQS